MGEMADYYLEQDMINEFTKPLPEDRSALASQTHSYFTALHLRLLEEVASAYSADPSTASVTMARLPDGTWYGSVVRYQQPYGEARIVVAKASSRMPAGMLVLLVRQWCGFFNVQEHALLDLTQLLYESLEKGDRA